MKTKKEDNKMEKVVIFMLKLITLLDVPEVFIAAHKEENAWGTISNPLEILH